MRTPIKFSSLGQPSEKWELGLSIPPSSAIPPGSETENASTEAASTEASSTNSTSRNSCQSFPWLADIGRSEAIVFDDIRSLLRIIYSKSLIALKPAVIVNGRKVNGWDLQREQEPIGTERTLKGLGVQIREQLISVDEEKLFLAFVAGITDWRQTLRRRVIHYGHDFLYENLYIDQKPSKTGPIPDIFNPLIQRMFQFNIIPELPDQLTINEYLPGQGIGFHVDTHSAFTTWIASCSIGSGAMMEFRRRQNHQLPSHSGKYFDGETLLLSGTTTTDEPQNRWESVWAYLPRRSACVFKDESRYGWQHGIKARRTDVVDGVSVERGTRISLTFRKLNWSANFVCKCTFASLCDSAHPESLKLPTRLSSSMSDHLAGPIG